MFSNPDHMRHTKEMQLKHWDVIAGGTHSSEAYGRPRSRGSARRTTGSGWSRAGTSVAIAS